MPLSFVHNESPFGLYLHFCSKKWLLLTYKEEGMDTSKLHIYIAFLDLSTVT